MRSGTAVARLRAFAAVPEMVAIRTALPYSFVGLVLGIATFVALQPSGEFLQKFYRAFAPAFGIMAALLLVLLTIDLAKRRNVPPAAALPIACAVFLLSLPYRHASSPVALLRALGTSGLFLAIVVAIAVVALLAVSRARLGSAGGTFVAASLAVGVAALLFFFGISLTEWLDVAIAPLGTLGDSLAALLVITLVETLLWTIGIHGPALLAAVVLPVYLQLQFENTEAMAHGLPLPHVVTVSTFLFVFPGGAGATLPLVLLLLRNKIKRARQVALATLVPTLFNANEPLMFGLPLVSNPYLSVPFVLAPLVLALVTWFAMHLGLVARPALYIPSSVPLPISVVLATKDWRAVVLIAINVGLAAAIYAPFVRLFERHEAAETA
jgi:PTS system cellobiose-specific IIC component